MKMHTVNNIEFETIRTRFTLHMFFNMYGAGDGKYGVSSYNQSKLILVEWTG